MEWHPVSERPPNLTEQEGGQITARLLLWVDDMQRAVMGQCIQRRSGELLWIADGFIGKFDVTHWMVIEKPVSD